MLAFSNIASAQMLRTEGKEIVNTNDEPVLLRGMGLGGWALMEGYMMQSTNGGNTQHEFRANLVEMMGEERTNEFFAKWRANHCTREDIDSLASWGFNSVRLPMHYNLFTLPIEQEPVPGEHTWIEPGFAMIDSLIEWCTPHEMYVILDLHAAPGGQGYDQAISDYDPSKPSLWESKDNRDKTVALWKKIAQRYKDEPWVGGYDLINEPNWDLPGGSVLRQLYEEITDSIRAQNDQHIIFIEGNWFANDHTGLTPPWDDELVYSFHKYWSTNTATDLDWILPLREQYNVPLWMGESGENSNVWFRDAIRLFENNNIGWAWWTMKKIENITNPYNVTLNEGYRNILEYWKGNAPKPSADDTYSAMMQLAENLKLENATFMPDVVDAMFRQVYSDETKPFKQHTIPGLMYMADYDLGRQNIAYYDMTEANYHLSTGTYTAGNQGYMYRNDGVDIEANDDNVNNNGFHVAFVEKNEWINYTVDILEGGIYNLKGRYAALEDNGMLHFSLDGQAVTKAHTVGSTGGWTTFDDFMIEGALLTAGRHVLTFHVDGEKAFNLASIEFTKTGDLEAAPFEVLAGSTTDEENIIRLELNMEADMASIAANNHGFSLSADGLENPIVEILKDSENSHSLIFVTTRDFKYSDNITLFYDGSEVQSVSGKLLAAGINIAIVNSIPVRNVIPGQIQAEDFVFNEGFALENCTDTGGGKNLAYTNPGDYADYLVHVADEMEYTLMLRVAALNKAGRLAFYRVDDAGEESELMVADIPVTGGWQDWQTSSYKIVLPAGSYILRIKVVETEFNLNWMKFLGPVLDADDEQTGWNIQVFPNPAQGQLFIQGGSFDRYILTSIDGRNQVSGVIGSSRKIDTSSLHEGLFVIQLVNKYAQTVYREKVMIAR